MLVKARSDGTHQILKTLYFPKFKKKSGEEGREGVKATT